MVIIRLLVTFLSFARLTYREYKYQCYASPMFHGIFKHYLCLLQDMMVMPVNKRVLVVKYFK